MAVPKYINTVVGLTSTAAYTGGGINFPVELPNGVIYSFFINTSNNDPSYVKSIDYGMTWSNPVALKSCTGTQIAVWYDRWSGLNTDLIHVVYSDSISDDTFYRNIDAANNDSLSTETTVFAGASAVSGGAISIARMRGGNLIVVGSIDSGAEMFSKKSTDIGANWSDIAAGYEAAQDICIVMPGWGTDNQDAMMFYYDISASEVSVKYFDDSANTWSETSIATSIVLPNYYGTSNGFMHISATIDLINSQNLLVFWTAVDTANADLRCFKVTQSAQTETTSNVVLDSVDDQGFCAISTIGSSWIVVYCGSSDGNGTFFTNIPHYYKISSDGGATWSTEVKIDNSEVLTPRYIFMNPIVYKNIGILTLNSATLHITYTTPLGIPRANYILGI